MTFKKLLLPFKKISWKTPSFGHSPAGTVQGSYMLNLGCGANFHPMWANFDVSPVNKSIAKIDLNQPLALPRREYRVCYLSHVLEHLSRGRAGCLLHEIYGFLTSGGVVRVVVPDLEIICRRYLEELHKADHGEPESAGRHEWMTMELIDQMTRTFPGGFMARLWWSRPLPSRDFIVGRLGEEAGKWLREIDGQIEKGSHPLAHKEVFRAERQKEKDIVFFRAQGEVHQWMYDRVSLRQLLEKAGFRTVKVCGAAESALPNFASYNLDTDDDGNVRKPDSLFMEGIK